MEQILPNDLILQLPEELQEEGSTGRDLIDKIIYEAKRQIVREKNEEINSREVYWRDVVDKAKKQERERIMKKIDDIALILPELRQALKGE